MSSAGSSRRRAAGKLGLVAACLAFGSLLGPLPAAAAFPEGRPPGGSNGLVFGTARGCKAYVAVETADSNRPVELQAAAEQKPGPVAAFDGPVLRAVSYYPIRWRLQLEDAWFLELSETRARCPTVYASRRDVRKLRPDEPRASRWPERPAAGEEEPGHIWTQQFWDWRERIPYQRTDREDHVIPLKPADALFAYARANDRLPVYLDILPESPESLRLFGYMGGSVHIWHLASRRIEEKVAELETFFEGAIKVDFAEPFHVYERAGAYFFVTDSGGIHIESRPHADVRKARLLWPAKPRRVLVLLVDAETEKAYAFGSDFLFEVRQKPDPQPFDIRPAPDITAEEPLRTLLHCARKVLELRGKKRPARARRGSPPGPSQRTMDYGPAGAAGRL